MVVRAVPICVCTNCRTRSDEFTGVLTNSIDDALIVGTVATNFQAFAIPRVEIAQEIVKHLRFAKAVTSFASAAASGPMK